MIPLKVRSMVGLIPLFAVETLDPDLLDRAAGIQGKMRWNGSSTTGPDLAALVSRWQEPGTRRAASAVAAARQPHEETAEADAG
jgi:hypothetical protein